MTELSNFRADIVFVLQHVTFQAVYVTDGVRAFAFYFYKKDGMLFTDSQQFIGILADGNADGFKDSADGSFLRTPDKNIQSTTCK